VELNADPLLKPIKGNRKELPAAAINKPNPLIPHGLAAPAAHSPNAVPHLGHHLPLATGDPLDKKNKPPQSHFDEF